MGAAGLTAKQLEDILTGMMMRFGCEWTRRETDALAEAIRRLQQHEQLLRDARPDLRWPTARLPVSLNDVVARPG